MGMQHWPSLIPRLLCTFHLLLETPVEMHMGLGLRLALASNFPCPSQMTADINLGNGALSMTLILKKKTC